MTNDISDAVMRPAVDRQAEDASHIQRRNAFQAKLFLVLSTAVFSSYATYTLFRYLTLVEFHPISLPLLVILAVAMGERWRAA